MEEQKPDWIKMSPEELKGIILKLAKQGETPSKIGIILRDQHGIPKAKILGKKISQIIKEENMELNFEENLTKKKIEKINVHIAKNKHDYCAKRSLTKNLWAIHDIEKAKEA